MSEPGNGISRMSSMLNITRIHNSLWALANMRRFDFIFNDWNINS